MSEKASIQRRRISRNRIVFLIITFTVALVVAVMDQTIKHWVVTANVTYRINTGGFLGLFAGAVWIQGMAHWLLVVMLGYLFFFQKKYSFVEGIALGLLVGGGVGNSIDRWRYGGVVDFINLPLLPTFNLADAAITAAVGLVILS